MPSYAVEFIKVLKKRARGLKCIDIWNYYCGTRSFISDLVLMGKMRRALICFMLMIMIFSIIPIHANAQNEIIQLNMLGSVREQERDSSSNESSDRIPFERTLTISFIIAILFLIYA